MLWHYFRPTCQTGSRVMRAGWKAVLGIAVVVLAAGEAGAQGFWGRGGSRVTLAPWNKHQMLQTLPSVPARGPLAGAAQQFPSASVPGVVPAHGNPGVQPWPPVPAAGFLPAGASVPGGAYQGAVLPGQPAPLAPSWPGTSPAVGFAGQVPPTAYHPPTAVYHAWPPPQVRQALYQAPSAAPASVRQFVPTVPGQATATDSLPGVSIRQPQAVVGTVDRSALQPSWWERLRALWPFGR